jgi:hypothetical protein
MTFTVRWQNSMVLEVVRVDPRLTPDTLSPLWRRRSRMHFRLHAADTVGKRGGCCGTRRPVRLRCDGIWMATSRGPHARPPSWPLVERTLAPSRPIEAYVRTTSSSGRLFTRSAAMMRVTSMEDPRTTCFCLHTHHNQRRLGDAMAQSNNFGTLE